MGDRANVAVRHEMGMVYFYTHWHGSELPEIMRVALSTPEARARWHDAPYLTRILADQLSSETGARETGMGISTELGDNNGYPVMVIDPSLQVVYYKTGNARLNCTVERVSFEKFCAQEYATWPDGKGYEE